MTRKLVLVCLIACVATFAWAAGESESASQPAKSDKVVIYSPAGDTILGKVAEDFEEATGYRLEYLFAGGGELVDRIRAEAANPQADVLYGNPSSVFEELKAEGMWEAYTPTWANDLDPYFKDPDGTWYGTIQTPVVLFYNHDMLSASEAPGDWFDLIDPQYQDDIIIRSTTSAASRALHASLMYQFYKEGTLESDGWEFFGKLDANIKRYVYNSGLMFQAIGRQEGSIGFWVLSGVIDNIEKNNMPYTIVDSRSGSPVITDGIAIVKGTKRRDAAEAFVEWAGSPEVQLMLAEEFNRMPTHPEALERAPTWMQEFTYSVMDVDWGILAEKQSEWLQYYEDNVRDSAKVDQDPN